MFFSIVAAVAVIVLHPFSVSDVAIQVVFVEDFY